MTTEPPGIPTGDVHLGIFDGFEGYLSATDDDYRHVLTSGLVVLDTNVLLNLYRYSAAARDEFLAILEKIGRPIWVPNHVLKEFWRRRESAVRAPIEQAGEFVEELDRSLKLAQDRIRHWASRTGTPPEKWKVLEERLVIAFAGVQEEISSLPDEEAIEAARDTNRDPVIPRLKALLDGQVGEPLGAEAFAQALGEAKRRIESRIPPGFKDDKKRTEEDAAGDYIVWEQILTEASARGVDVLLVTGDVKEDWWRIERGETRGPRPELAAELRQRAGTRLLMLRPESLALRASSVLALEVDQASVEDIERVDRSQDVGLAGGWTTGSILSLMKRLEREAPVQAKVVRAAVDNGGFVSRDDVYALGNFPEERWLNGFTRPVRRITKDLIDSGVVNPGAADLLVASYDDPDLPFGHAAGFVVPTSVIPLFGD